MPHPNNPPSSAGDPLDAIIAAYVQQIEAGDVPNREDMLAQHPELAERLREFFAGYDRLDRQAAELRLSADPNRTTDAPGPEGELPRVRYFGDYELLEEIARGGMGVVYKARQVSLNRVVALKMVLRGELATERDVARFRSEAESAANLDHPNIVPIYEVGEHDGQQYYAMRYVEGVSLARRPRDDARSEARLVAAVAGAVHHAHRRGVLHRDIKPSNILVDAASAPLVADFGLAKRVDANVSLTETGAIVGTPRYMAPEQASARKDLTVAVDVYSLGVVLYERLTGSTPFAGENVLELLRRAREEEPPRPSSVCPGVDRDLETICLKCLEKDPVKRYTSAEALQGDLECWLRGEPIKARPVGQTERLWRWCRRNPVVAGLSAGLAVALLAGTAISLAFGFRERHERQRAEQAEEIAVAAQDDLEQALARSLVRPLNPKGNDTLSEPEVEALWELAEKPGERLWLRFVTEAMRTPLTISQLSHRAEPSWLAAVGLDSAKRKQVEQLLNEQLETPNPERRRQFDLIGAYRALMRDQPSVSDRRIADFLVQELALRDNWDRAQALTEMLVEYANHLEPDEAARVFGQAVRVLSLSLATNPESPPSPMVGHNYSPRWQLAEGLVVVAGRLKPSETVRVLTLALEEKTDYGTRWILAKGLAATAGRLEHDEVTGVLGQAARKLILDLEPESYWQARKQLAEDLLEMTGQMEPQEATRVLSQVARVLTLAVEKGTNDSSQDYWTRGELAKCLAAVAERLEPAEAVRVCNQAARALILALEKEMDLSRRGIVARGLIAVVRRLGAREAVRMLTAALKQEASPRFGGFSPDHLAEGLVETAGRLEPREAVRVLTQALETKPNPYGRRAIAEGVAAAAGRLTPGTAARELGHAVRVLKLALEKDTSGWAREPLTLGLAAVIECQQGLGEAARILSLALEKEPNSSEVAEALAAVAGRLEPGAAARMLGQAARALISALEQETGSDRRYLAAGLAAVVGRMELHEGARVLSRVLERETDATALYSLAKGLAGVAPRLNPAEAVSICRPAAQKLLKATAAKNEGERSQLTIAAVHILSASSDAEVGSILKKHMLMLFSGPGSNRNVVGYSPDGEELNALLTDASRSEVRRRTAAVMTILGLRNSTPFGALPVLPTVSEPLPCRFSTQDLVELLKMPTCFGEARKVVLKHLGNRYGRTFANHWQFVRFAQEQHLDLDLTSPPKRPRRP